MAIDELHFVVEALGDAVVFGKAPHGDDFLRPGGKSLTELDQLRKAGLAQLVDSSEEAWDQDLALAAGTMFLQQQIAEFLFEAINEFQRGMRSQISGEFLELFRAEVIPDSDASTPTGPAGLQPGGPTPSTTGAGASPSKGNPILRTPSKNQSYLSCVGKTAVEDAVWGAVGTGIIVVVVPTVGFAIGGSGVGPEGAFAGAGLGFAFGVAIAPAAAIDSLI